MRGMILSIAGVCLLASATSAQTTGKQAPMGADTALVVVDIQQFYFEGGLVPLTGSVEAAAQARKVLEAFRKEGVEGSIVGKVDGTSKLTLSQGEEDLVLFDFKKEIITGCSSSRLERRVRLKE